MSILSDYYNHYSRSTILLQTVTSLTKFYGKDYAGDFFAVIRHIGDMALLNLEYNDESYVRELMQLFAVVPVICCSQLNRDTSVCRLFYACRTPTSTRRPRAGRWRAFLC